MISYTLTVTHTDDDPATNVVVSSSDPTVVIGGSGILGSVAPGATRQVTATKPVTIDIEGTTDTVTFTASGTIDGAVDMGSVSIPVSVPAPPLIFRQDVSAGPAYFATFDEAINFPDPSPATAARYSRLSQLENLRNAAGLLHFRLVYPQTGDVFEWTQQSNPLTAAADTVTGFTLLSATASAAQFGGLANSGGAPGVLAWFNGMPGTPNWFAAIAASSDWPGTGEDDFPGLPVTPTTFTQVAELYVIDSVNDPVPPTQNPPPTGGPVPFTESRLQGAGNGQATGTQITQPVFTPDRQMEIRTVQLSIAGGLFGTSTDTTIQMRQGANATGPVLATSDTLPLTGTIAPRVFTFPPGAVIPAGVAVTFTAANPSPSQQWEIDPIGSDFYTDTNLLELSNGLTDRGAPLQITGFEV